MEIDFKNLRYTFRDSVKVTELYFKEGVDDSDQCWTDGINSGSCPTKCKYFNFAGNSSKLPICKTLEEVHCIKAHAHDLNLFINCNQKKKILTLNGDLLRQKKNIEMFKMTNLFILWLVFGKWAKKSKKKFLSLQLKEWLDPLVDHWACFLGTSVQA